jgi:predicted deacylase
MKLLKATALAMAWLSSLAGGDSTTGQADGHATFSVGTAKAARSQRATGVIHVPAGVDPGYDIPVGVIHGAKPGPVLAVVAGSHGTEYASILAVEELMATSARTAVDPACQAP